MEHDLVMRMYRQYNDDVRRDEGPVKVCASREWKDRC